MAMRNSATGSGRGIFDIDRLDLLCDAIRKSVRTEQVDIEWHEPNITPKTDSVGAAKKRLRKFNPRDFERRIEAPIGITEDDTVEGATTEVSMSRPSAPPSL